MSAFKAIGSSGAEPARHFVHWLVEDACAARITARLVAASSGRQSLVGRIVSVASPLLRKCRDGSDGATHKECLVRLDITMSLELFT